MQQNKHNKKQQKILDHLSILSDVS